MIDASKQTALWAVDADGGNVRLLIDGDNFNEREKMRMRARDMFC